MKKLLILPLALLCALCVQAQSAYITPNPTDGVEELTLFVDVSQTSGSALKAMLEANPDESVYLWTWNPSSPVGGNGEWSSSSEDNLMTKEAPLLYSFTFNVEDFYGVGPSVLFQNGINCLAKLQNGNAYADLEIGEAKTEDLSVEVVPKLCDRLHCTFPEIGDADDFWTLTYDNNYEPNPNYQNAGENDVYVFLAAKQDGFNVPAYVPADMVTSTAALQMSPVDGDPGHFRLTVIPNDFFAEVIDTANGPIQEIRYYIIVNGQPLPAPPSIKSYGTLPCD